MALPLIHLATSYKEYLELVDFYELTSFRDPNHPKDIFIACQGDGMKVSLTNVPPDHLEGDDLTAYALGHLPSNDVLEPIMGSINSLMEKDLNRVRPIKIMI